MSEELGSMTVKVEKVLIWLSPFVLALGGWYMAHADNERKETKAIIDTNAEQISENAEQISRLIRVVEVADSEQAHVIETAKEVKAISNENRERLIRLEAKVRP